MRPLTADDLIRVWELGYRQDSAERAVTLLAVAFPEKSCDELRHLSLGQRNAHLLRVRQRLFGSELHAFSECPSCGERLEFALNVDALRDAGPAPTTGTQFDLKTEGYAVRFRLLDTDDLRAAAAAANVDAARKALLERCVLRSRYVDEIVTVAELPESVIEQLATRLAECDPQAEALIDLACPVCEFRSNMPFDVALFCYTEISAQAQLLLRAVHRLARAYAWRESDILAMSTQRRLYYLEMLGQ